MKITKAVITCAGFGTRFLPISKTIQKEMLPVLNKPTIDYVVDECIEAGITDIIIVMNSHNYQPLHYFRENQRLEKYLQKTNKSELYPKIAQLHKKANFHFIKQTDEDLYGTSIPIKLSRSLLEQEEAFLYLTGDDFIFYPDDNKNLIKELIDLHQHTQADAVITCIHKPKEELYRYGVAAINQENGIDYLKTFVEKPKPGTEPSDLANVSKYVLTPQIFELIENQSPNLDNGEYYITDIVLKLAESGKVAVKTTDAYFLNSGEPTTWLQSNLTLASQDPKLRKQVEEFMQNKWPQLCQAATKK